jgi:hypothetical protein
MSRDASADGRPARDLALYERLIDDGIAVADSRGGVIDHVTARRMAIWLISRPQEPDFTRGLIRFARSGAISHALKTQLRNYARSTWYPHRPQAARLMEYTVARGTNLGPIGTDFANICDQIDRADEMLTGLRDRIRDEAHVREVEQYGQSLHEDSYGRRNRQAIAARETRVAARLRAVEHAYRTAADPDAAPEADRTRAARSAAMAAERELELG